MDNYKIKVQVEIEESADTTTDGPRKEDVWVFEWVGSAEQARSIDECEQIVLRTNHDALRDAFAHHLSNVSQQYALEIAGSLEKCEVKPYRVDGETGQITFDTYWVEQMQEKSDDTAGTPRFRHCTRRNGIGPQVLNNSRWSTEAQKSRLARPAI